MGAFNARWALFRLKAPIKRYKRPFKHVMIVVLPLAFSLTLFLTLTLTLTLILILISLSPTLTFSEGIDVCR